MSAQREARPSHGRDGVWLPTAAEAAAIDARSHDTANAAVLMESAGRAAASVLQRLHPRGRVLGFAGGGNNGGDLLVMLRTLHAWGRDVAVLTVGAREPDHSLLHGHHIDIHRFTDFPRDIGHDVIVDGVLGTGARGAPRPDAAAAIRVMNAMARPIVSLDLPSGVDATTGAVPGEAVLANSTITFGWPKLGMLLHPARSRCGRIIAVEIGFPPVTSDDAAAEAITAGWARARTPTRTPDAHKGTSGTLLVVAGQTGMAGAALFAAGAAVRTGAGMVRIASAEENRNILQLAVPEATFIDRASLVADTFRRLTAIVAGPGLGMDREARRTLESVIAHGAGIPTLLDADALNLLASELDTLRTLAGDRPLLVTPHPKELSRLTGLDVEAITQDCVAAARQAAAQLGCTVLLKGQPSIVAAPSGQVLVNANTSSDVAVAGMGDQLAGTIAGFMAAGAGVMEAAGLGLFYASRAAQIAAEGRALSPASVTANLAAALVEAGRSTSPPGLPFITFDQPLPA